MFDGNTKPPRLFEQARRLRAIQAQSKIFVGRACSRRRIAVNPLLTSQFGCGGDVMKIGRMKKLNVLVAILLASTATAAQAGTFFTNTTGLAGSHSTVTFDELTFPDGTLITTQYAPFGVTLNNGTMNVQDGFVPRNYVGNFTGPTQFPDLQITFGSAVTAGAFDLVTNPGNSTINVYLGNTLVDSTVFATGLSAAFFGYTGSSFDRFQILAPSNAALEVGTVQFAGGDAAVPEPAQWALLIGGFAFAGAALRRRRETLSVTYA